MLVAGPIRAPEIARSVPSNALQVRLPNEGIDILGLRVPDYSKDPRTKRACWDWVIDTANSLKDRPSVLIGDFNTDPKYSKSRCGDCFGKLTDAGWQLASPPPGGSYWSLNGHSVRIDHAFVSRHFTIAAAAYVSESHGHIFAGNAPDVFSDHAALSIDMRLILPVPTEPLIV